MAVSAFQDYPLADRDREWNGAAAEKRVRRWAGAEDGYLRGNFLLEGFQHQLFELICLLRAESFVGTVRELLGLETDVSVKLHFEPLAGTLVYPLAVDALRWGDPFLLPFFDAVARTFNSLVYGSVKESVALCAPGARRVA